MNVGIEIVSSATNSVMRSRAEAMMLMPNADDEQQDVELALVVVALADVVDREQDVT